MARALGVAHEDASKAAIDFMTARSYRFRCVVCGKDTAGRKARGGDTMYPRRHDFAGEWCLGNIEEAAWIEVDRNPNEIIGRRVRLLATHRNDAGEAYFEGEVFVVGGKWRSTVRLETGKCDSRIGISRVPRRHVVAVNDGEE